MSYQRNCYNALPCGCQRKNFYFLSINDKVYFMNLKNALTAEYETGYMYRGQERMLNFGVKTEF